MMGPSPGRDNLGVAVEPQEGIDLLPGVATLGPFYSTTMTYKEGMQVPNWNSLSEAKYGIKADTHEYSRVCPLALPRIS